MTSPKTPGQAACEAFAKQFGIGHEAAPERWNAIAAAAIEAAPVPIHAVCPKCDGTHIDLGRWAVKLHRSHLCEHCGHVWRPFEYYTVGVHQPPTPPAASEDEREHCERVAIDSVNQYSHDNEYEYVRDLVLRGRAAVRAHIAKLLREDGFHEALEYCEK